MNLYRINSLYVNTDDLDINIEAYALANNDTEMYDIVEDIYGFVEDDKDYVIENQGEIEICNNSFDDYYETYVYGWELVEEDVSDEKAKEMVGTLVDIYKHK